MRVFQKRMLSGRPSRSRGPGSSSRKKSASWASKERRPLGTILMGLLSEDDMGDGVAAGGEPGAGSRLPAGGTPERKRFLSSSVEHSKKWRRSSARSLAVV